MASSVNLDISQQLDITCRRGDTFVLKLSFTNDQGGPFPVDSPHPTLGSVPTYGFSMDVRESDTDDGAQALLSTDSNSIAAGLTRPITISYVAPVESGVIQLKVDADVMSQIPGGSYVYDLQANTLDGDGNITKIETWVFGAFTVNEDVTIRNV